MNSPRSCAAWLLAVGRRIRGRGVGPSSDEPERGASLVEYALLIALFVAATTLAVDYLTASSGDYLSSTGDSIGTPRERVADHNSDLPDPPDWLD